MKGKVTSFYIQHTGARKKVSQEKEGSWFTNEAGGTVLGVNIEIPAKDAPMFDAEAKGWKLFLISLVDEMQESELEAIALAQKPAEAQQTPQEQPEQSFGPPEQGFGPPEEKTAIMGVSKICFEQRKDQKYELGLFDVEAPGFKYPELRFVADRERMWGMVGHIEAVDWQSLPFEKDFSELGLKATWKYGREYGDEGKRYKDLLALEM